MKLLKSIVVFVVYAAELFHGTSFQNPPQNSIQINPPNISLVFWQSTQVTLKLNSKNQVNSLITLIVYPCNVIRVGVSINRSSLEASHYDHDEVFLREFLNITGSNRGFEKCAYAYELKNIGYGIFTEEIIMRVEAKWLGEEAMTVLVWKDNDGQ